MTTAIETIIATKTEYQIPSALLQKKVQVIVVGCGGTGSAIATGLPQGWPLCGIRMGWT